MNSISSTSLNFKSHWDKVYLQTDDLKLGWYEDIPVPSIELLRRTGISKSDNILIAGAGLSTLIDWLVKEHFTNVIACDISKEAIQKLVIRINQRGGKIKTLVDDLTAPTKVKEVNQVMLWHDRAVLHFLTRDEDIDTYFETVRTVVSPGGYVIIGEFSKEGPGTCSGLPVINYSVEMISRGLGIKFYLVDSFNYIHKTPSGALRPYIYTLYRKHSSESE